jgi:hypothetical protein
MTNGKSEARSTKSETNSKFEEAMFQTFLPSCFEFVSDCPAAPAQQNVLRASDFPFVIFASSICPPRYAPTNSRVIKTLRASGG